ncbi:MAG TPA: hypothetical protein VG894_00110 [Bauldia sp.]|nr:hypothetical protein [Bauldia sp.]
MIANSTRFRIADADEPVAKDIDSQIARLRQVLTLMAPETGSSALGAMRRAAPHVPLSERVRLLTEYRR